MLPSCRVVNPAGSVLTEKEINMVCTAKDNQVQASYLKDEISDLDKDDPCFDGSSQSALLDDTGLLAEIQKRWYPPASFASRS